MTEPITLTKAALVTLLDVLLFPSPEDSGELHLPWEQYDLTGLVIHLTYYDSSGGLLGPQPFPDRSSSSQNPWGVALLARSIIDQAVAHVQLAEGFANTDQAERMTETIRADIREFVDDFCGTLPPRWPRPWPWPPTLVSTHLRPLDLLIAGAQFQKAAAYFSTLQADLSFAADQLFATGFKRMENR